MNRFEFKKLVSVFLLVSTVLSSLALLFSNSILTFSSDEAPEANPASGYAAENAFVEPIPEFPLEAPAFTGTIPESELPEVPATDNLTEQFAAQLAREFLRTNPRGPQEGSSGERTFTSPDEATIAMLITKDANTQAITSFIETPATPAPKHIIQNPTQEDLAVYLARIDRLVHEHLSTSRLPSSPDALAAPNQTLNAMRTAIEMAMVDLEGVNVPKPFENLHTNLAKLLAYQHQDVALAMGGDPLRAYYSLTAHELTYTNTLQTVLREAERAKQLLDRTTSQVPNAPPLLAGLFFVPTAHAVLGVGDIVFDPSIFKVLVAEHVQSYKQILLDILTQVVKTQIVHRMTMQVVNWIQGGGKPQFVQNWKGFIQNAGNDAAGAVVQSIAPGLCTPFRGLVTASLKLSFGTGKRLFEPYTCTLDQVVANIKDFERDFRNGGLRAYLAVVQPQNNMWGAMALTHEAASQEAEQIRASVALEASAAGGFLSTKICVAPKTITIEKRPPPQNCDPTTFGGCQPEIDELTTESEIKSFPGYVPGSARCEKNGTCSSYQVCDANDWQVTTPGGIVANITSQAITSPIPNIVDAEDIGAIISALVDSALNKLLFNKDRGLAGISPGSGSAQQDPEGKFFDETYKIINNKGASLALYDQILETGSRAQENFVDAVIACDAVISEATSAGSRERADTFSERRKVALNRQADLATLLAPIPALRDALASEIQQSRAFVDAVEKERTTGKTINYTEKLTAFSSQFGTAQESRKELGEVQDLYVRIQTKDSQSVKSLDACTPGTE